MKFCKALSSCEGAGLRYNCNRTYARIDYDEEKGRYLLKKSANTAKDQSYVLYFMTQDQLAHTCFPLGEYSDKEQVRAVAEKYGFVNARKHDSQDICFVPDGNYGNFIEEYSGKTYPPGVLLIWTVMF